MKYWVVLKKYMKEPWLNFLFYCYINMASSQKYLAINLISLLELSTTLPGISSILI